ncbi:divalent-cation tolerance protein CutA [Anianabacter salinae]|uniref:divalent-cation tolerance protein CutA n=1 Tax=Anianabacter salinae TaxID=2851023 RepID=UPI00225DD7A2|nr:divalent cation tolerance protein CutA [Anianabacter salinae]MBV0912648.1 divalent-cation tolerance protein CutA [Anianabacter salinae]
MTHPVDLHVTCPDEATAEAIARAAIAARLAACANLQGPVKSLFHWEGAVDSGTEWALAFKTRDACAQRLVALIRAEHPYDLPAITWTRVQADADTAAWIATETGG